MIKNLIEYPGAIIGHPQIKEPQLITNRDLFSIFKIVEDYNRFYRKNFAKEKENFLIKLKIFWNLILL